jgi:hypothetical protein
VLRETGCTWAWLFDAVCSGPAVTAAQVMPSAGTPAVNAPLAEIARTVTAGAPAIPVPDDAGWHGAKALCLPGDITLLPRPPCAPQLNPVGTLCACLLAISVFETCGHIVTRCGEAWNFCANATPAIRSITSRDHAKTLKSQGRGSNPVFRQTGRRVRGAPNRRAPFHCASDCASRISVTASAR